MNIDRDIRRIVADAVLAGDLDNIVENAILLLDPATVVAANEALPRECRKLLLPFPHPKALLSEDLKVGMFVRLAGWNHNEVGLITSLGKNEFTLRLSVHNGPHRAWKDDLTGTFNEKRTYGDTGVIPYASGYWNQANRLEHV